MIKLPRNIRELTLTSAAAGGHVGTSSAGARAGGATTRESPAGGGPVPTARRSDTCLGQVTCFPPSSFTCLTFKGMLEQIIEPHPESSLVVPPGISHVSFSFNISLFTLWTVLLILFGAGSSGGCLSACSHVPGMQVHDGAAV